MLVLRARACGRLFQVPALFVLLAGAVAIPANAVMGDSVRRATGEVAGGALLVTYAFELTKGYTLLDDAGSPSRPLIFATFAGTILSGQVQAAAQGMWPFGNHGVVPSNDADNGGADAHVLSWTDSVPFMIAFFVDGVVLAVRVRRCPVLILL